MQDSTICPFLKKLYETLLLNDEKRYNPAPASFFLTFHCWNKIVVQTKVGKVWRMRTTFYLQASYIVASCTCKQHPKCVSFAIKLKNYFSIKLTIRFFDDVFFWLAIIPVESIHGSIPCVFDTRGDVNPHQGWARVLQITTQTGAKWWSWLILAIRAYMKASCMGI